MMHDRMMTGTAFALGSVLYLIGASITVLFVWPLISYAWHYWVG
jgi:hypothetical protein